MGGNSCVSTLSMGTHRYTLEDNTKILGLKKKSFSFSFFVLTIFSHQNSRR